MWLWEEVSIVFFYPIILTRSLYFFALIVDYMKPLYFKNKKIFFFLKK